MSSFKSSPCGEGKTRPSSFGFRASGWANLVEGDWAEGVEVRQDIADARERRGADARRVALEPACDELA